MQFYVELALAALVSSYKVVPRAFNGDLKCIILLLTVALIITIFILLIFRYLKFPTPTDVAVVGIDSFKNRY